MKQIPSDQSILEALNKHPRKNIAQVAIILGIPTITVAKAQHQFMKSALSEKRVSKKWYLLNTKRYSHNLLKAS